jgi:rifampicin phosphotransferase
VTHRRQGYERELRRGHIPRVLLSHGTEPEAGTPPTIFTDGGLVGTAASAGMVTGQARVVLDPTGAHLQPGEILVVPSTDPGWTPLFLTAGGLVTEIGGANSHGAGRRARVRHPGRRRGGECDKPYHHRTAADR